MISNTCSIRGTINVVVPVILAQQKTSVAVGFSGAAVGDFVLLSPNHLLYAGMFGNSGLDFVGEVTAPDVITVVISNQGGTDFDGDTFDLKTVLIRATGSV